MENNSNWADVVGKIAVWIVIVGIVIAIYVSTSNDKEKIVRQFDGSITLVEAKYFWGGSWFEKDVLEVSNTGVSIHKYSLINSKEPDTVNIPFNKIKKVIFIEGKSIYEVDIVYKGNFLDNKEEFYIRDRISFIAVTDNIRVTAINQITINEKKTFVKKLTDGIKSLDKKQ